MTSVPRPLHSAAPALPRGVQREQRARARHLRVAEVARRQRRARYAVWATALMTALALFVLVAFHVLAVQHSFALDRLNEQQHTEQLRYERLRDEVATLSSPQAIVSAAKKQGMQAPESIDWITAPAAAPHGSSTEQTSSTLADIHGEAKKRLDP
jgi:cell division protein FtsL